MYRVFCVFFLCTLFVIGTAAAQSSCVVVPDNLKGEYIGACKNGFAEGKGKATGNDSYEGVFRQGWPEGKGIYRFSNGNYYSGNFLKGRFEGRGEMHFLMGTRPDSLVKGVWADNNLKDYEKSYEILGRSSSITRINVRSNRGDVGRIVINSRPLARNATLSTFGTKADSISNFRTNVGSAPDHKSPGIGYRDPNKDLTSSRYFNSGIPISNISISRGNYLNILKRATDKVATTELQGVEFPFKALVYFEDAYIEFIINEPGSWSIDATISIEQ